MAQVTAPASGLLRLIPKGPVLFIKCSTKNNIVCKIGVYAFSFLSFVKKYPDYLAELCRINFRI